MKFLSWLAPRLYGQRFRVLFLWGLLLILALFFLLRHGEGQIETELTGARHTEAYRVSEILRQDFGQRLGSTAAVVLPADQDPSPLSQALKTKFTQIDHLTPIQGEQKHHWQLLRVDFDPQLPLVDTQALSDDLRAFLQTWAQRAHTQVYLTGSTAFQHDAKVESKKDSRRGESLALLASLVILVLNFGALSSALLPLLMGASTLILLNSLIALLGWSVNPVSRILTSLVGLALGIDYALFMVSRYREEVQRQAPAAALAVALEQAGQTILFSGLIMICSLSALLIPDVSLSRTVMLHLMVVIVLSLLHALFILPALLALLSVRDWLSWPQVLSRRVQRLNSYPYWRRFSQHVVQHALRYFLLALVLLGGLSWPVTQMKLWEPVQGIAPPQSESMQAYDLLVKDGWGGELMPVVLVAKAPKSVYDRDFIQWLYQLDRHLAALPETQRVRSLVSGSGSVADYQSLYAGLGAMGFMGQPQALSQWVNPRDPSLCLVYVFPRNTLELEDTRQILRAARSYAKAHPEYPLLTGGIVARVQDFTHELYHHTPWMLSLIFGGIFLLLWGHMRSPILPLKAALMNFLPILGAFGILTLVFQYGWGSHWLHTPNNGAVTNTVPIVLFCIVFGLSMDYEVLILSRVSEIFFATGAVEEAIVEGLARSGSVISGAVLILIGVFIPGVFSSSPQTQEICIGILAAIVLDATVVRLLLVPSFMALLGRWNWWRPGKTGLKRGWNRSA